MSLFGHVRRPSGAFAAGALVVGIFVVLAALALPGCGCGAEAAAGDDSTLATDFTGFTLGGEKVSLSQYRGKPLVLAFLASW